MKSEDGKNISRRKFIAGASSIAAGVAFASKANIKQSLWMISPRS